jgi:hypothetical protein
MGKASLNEKVCGGIAIKEGKLLAWAPFSLEEFQYT